MAPRLNKTGYDHARGLIAEGRLVADDRDDWSEHRPSTQQENAFIEAHGLAEFGKWHLGVDDVAGRETKGRFKYPYGDFENVHRCAVLSAESRAGQYDHEQIKAAAAHLHGMLEGATARR
jgi:hypothetical protein